MVTQFSTTPLTFLALSVIAQTGQVRKYHSIDVYILVNKPNEGLTILVNLSSVLSIAISFDTGCFVRLVDMEK